MPPAHAISSADRGEPPEPAQDASLGLLTWDPVGAPLPPTLPDGRPWPEVTILVVAQGAQQDAAAASSASIARQDYPAATVTVVPSASPGVLARAAERASGAFLAVLDAGDRLAPGALAALVLAAVRNEAAITVGLRVLHDRSTLAIDILSPAAMPAGHDRVAEPGGDVLVSLPALRAVGGLSPLADRPLADLLERMARAGMRVAPIGRPVLLRRSSSLEAQRARPTLRIAAVNDSGCSGGGAAIAHRRLVEALRFGGHEVATWRLNDASSPAAAEWTDAFPDIEAALLARKPDWVVAGNLHGATRSLDVLGRLVERVPVAAVLHDLFPLTGRCAQPDGCRLIESGCDAACPTSTFYPQLAPDRIADVFARKRRALASGTVLLANSDWTREQALAFAPPGSDVEQIELAFPTQVFRPPSDKAALRRRLGLPEHDILILFGAVIADQPSKGGPDLAAALSAVAGPGIGFVAIGRIDDPTAFPLPNLVTTGPIADEAELAAWYGACDLHVIASRLETFGQTAAEAALCGTPTVGYRLTGLTSAVIDGVSGILVDPRPDALAAAIRDLVADPARRAALGAWGRIALESRNSYAAAYLALHEMLVGRDLLAPAADGRIRLDPEVLRTFASSANPLPGESGTVRRPASRLTGLARRLKQRIWGRAQPLWMRRLLHAADRARKALPGAGS